MGSLQIVASQKDYKIYDRDENRMLMTGLRSFRNALTVYERLISLRESSVRYGQRYVPYPQSSFSVFRQESPENPRHV